MEPNKKSNDWLENNESDGYFGIGLKDFIDDDGQYAQTIIFPEKPDNQIYCPHSNTEWSDDVDADPTFY